MARPTSEADGWSGLCYKNQMSAFEEIKSLLHRSLDGAESFGADVLFEFGNDGAILVQGRGSQISLTESRGQADCEIIMSAAVFRRIMAGEINETTAFMEGEMRIVGDIALATKVSNLIRMGAVA